MVSATTLMSSSDRRMPDDAFANDGMIVRNQNAIMFVGNDVIWASNDS